MPVIDKKLYEVFKKWCDGERPKNQFMMYVNTNDRKLTNATIRKLMFEIYKEDVEGEEYVAFYSAENFYRNMHDYYSHVGEMYFKKPGAADPIEDIIKDIPPTCGWITLIVEDMEDLSGQNEKMQKMISAFISFAAKCANVILLGKGGVKDVFAGCDDVLEWMSDGIEAKEDDNRVMIGYYDQEAIPEKEKIVFESLEKQRYELDFYWNTIYEQLEEKYFDYEDFKTIYKETLEFLIPRVAKDHVYRKDLWLIENIGAMSREENKNIEGCKPWEFDSAKEVTMGLHKAVINTLDDNDEFSSGNIELDVEIKEPEKNYGAIRIGGYTCTAVCVNVDNVFKEIDDLAEAIHKTTYDEDFGYLWEYLKKKKSKESDTETSADCTENTANAMNKLMDSIKKAADKSLNKDPGRKVRRYTGDDDVNDTQIQEDGENSVLEILNKEYDIAPEEVKGYEKIEKEKAADVKKCKLYRFTVILKKEAYTINADGEPEMTCQAQKEYDDFVFKIRNDSIRDYIEIAEEGYGENEDELEWHVTGCVRKKTEQDSIEAIVEFEVCVRTEDNILL